MTTHHKMDLMKLMDQKIQHQALQRRQTRQRLAEEALKNPLLRRPTEDEIRQRVIDHIAYGWSPSPGSTAWNRVWTEEDFDTYMRIYKELKP